MGNCYKIVTQNVNGLRKDTKRREIFHYFNLKQVDVLYLQETHGDSVIEKQWSAELGKKMWFTHGDSNARGVAIALSKNSGIIVHNVIQSDEGRYLLLYTSWKKSKVLFVNVYAPNVDSPQFFSKMFEEINRFTPNFTVIGGDFNLGMNTDLDRKGTYINNDKAAKWVQGYLEEKNYLDVWRHFFPDKYGFTWRRSTRTRAYSRLDYIMVNESFLQFIDKIRIIPSTKSDHSILEVSLQNVDLVTGS